MKSLPLLILSKVSLTPILMNHLKVVKGIIYYIINILIWVHMTNMQVVKFYHTTNYQWITKILIINNQVVDFFIMSLDKKIHKMTTKMKVKVMIYYVILPYGNKDNVSLIWFHVFFCSEVISLNWWFAHALDWTISDLIAIATSCIPYSNFIVSL